MPLSIALREDDIVSINGELMITARIVYKSPTKREIRVSFEGPKEKYAIKRLSSLRKKLNNE